MTKSNIPLDLQKKAHQAHVLFWETIAKNKLETKEVKVVSTRLKNSFLNTVYQSNVPTYRLKNTCKAVADFFKQEGVPWSWDVTPFDKPANLPALLKQQGMEVALTCPNMVLDLTKPIPSLPMPDDRIIEATDVDSLNQWIVPINYAFDANASPDDGFYNVFSNLPYGEGAVFRHYVAFKEDEPVASASLSVSPAGARIDNVATHKRFQKEGHATALTAYMLNAAKEMGHTYCFLESSPEGYGLYKKFNFIDFGDTTIFQPKP